VKTLLCLCAILLLSPFVFSKSHNGDYQMGTFVRRSIAEDGTLTNTLRGDGTTVAGGVYANRVGLYTVKVPDGIWVLETYTQAADSTIRNMGATPIHFKSEKPNPLDALKDGDKVLFRVELHKKLFGSEIDVFIPFADKPDKEAKFVGRFTPNTPPAESDSKKPTDNVKAMCSSGRLSPELQKQYCSAQ